MRVVIQRVQSASVTIAGSVTAEIGKGMVILLGIEEADTAEDIEWLCGKISRLRIFQDKDGLMNLSVMEAGGELLVISQFTLFATTKKGNRPGFTRAAKPEIAIPVYERFLEQLKLETGMHVHSGIFGADMQIALVNNGPVTILIDTRNKE